MSLPFLPDKLELDGSYDRLIRTLYEVFSRDIFNLDFRYKSRHVICDDRILDTDYEEGFWHLITRGKGDRLIDYKRAKRMVWIKPLVENADDPHLYKWIEDATDRKGSAVRKTYIWYREGRYLIVLKEIPNRYFLVTAFHVTGPRNDQYYYRKWQTAKKKGPGC